MTINDVFEYFDLETTVCVQTSYGSKNRGIITGVENSFETDSGKDEIELDIGDCYLSIEIQNIVSIEKVN